MREHQRSVAFLVVLVTVSLTITCCSWVPLCIAMVFISCHINFRTCCSILLDTLGVELDTLRTCCLIH